ncbi:glycine--tRNA ligase subunit beta [Virgibacillus byunsanensis]|uniref:Glycine--tRNA ligase beta subunit n=1 Tax=Virgibacillus byunsanensis TaxID=570945 RepID=A0ABW3LKR6_9BACI
MTKDVLFEIGLEELPARFVDHAEKQLAEKTKDWLNELRIAYDSLVSYSTPRRLAVLVRGVAEEQTTIEEEAKGPTEKIAKDADGNWTKAAIGFTKGKGKTTNDIYTKEIKGTTYIFVKNNIEGKQTAELLPSFKIIIEAITFPKNMRWATQSMRYARPIRWLVALYDETVISLEIANVSTSNTTYGHRFLGEQITLDTPIDYENKLKDNYVIVDPNARQKLILNGIRNIENQENVQIPIDEKLLNEVRNLVEYPTVFMGTFKEQFLSIPSDVLIISMKEHQRYFPVKSSDGKLLPYFVGVRNGDDYALESVTKGNEKVLHARLSDAQFFYEEDLKHSIEFYLEKLEKVVFQEKLGTISDKVQRVVQMTEKLSHLLNTDNATTRNAARTAAICKFDLTTNMVNEFTELQGVIGETYANHFGEDAKVAQAIAEHYKPVHSDDNLPASVEGAIVSIADKLDTIVGCLSVGLIPTGSQDPYGLRRQAVGILKIVKENEWNVSIETLLDIAQQVYQQLNFDQIDYGKVLLELHDFFQLRATHLLKEEGIEQDVIQSVLDKRIGMIGYTMEKASVLSSKRNDDTFKHIQEALVRILNLSKKAQETTINPVLFETSSEKELFRKFELIQESYHDVNGKLDAAKSLEELGKLAVPIHSFFDHNMVMADEEEVRNNRLALVKSIADLIEDFADLSLIEWKQQF